MVMAMRPSKGTRAVDGKLLSRLEWPYNTTKFHGRRVCVGTACVSSSSSSNSFSDKATGDHL